jgi:DNA-binding XRE family transcriptional regulator
MPRLLRDWLEERLKDEGFLAEYLSLELKFQAAQETTKWRLLRGWSQETLAEQAGVPQPTVSRVENATNSPTLETIQSLAYAMRLRPCLEFEEIDETSDYPWAIIGSIPFMTGNFEVLSGQTWIVSEHPVVAAAVEVAR